MINWDTTLPFQPFTEFVKFMFFMQDALPSVDVEKACLPLCGPIISALDNWYSVFPPVIQARAEGRPDLSHPSLRENKGTAAISTHNTPLYSPKRCRVVTCTSKPGYASLKSFTLREDP